eukprot:10098560-Karenia_brevis.AAC.1
MDTARRYSWHRARVSKWIHTVSKSPTASLAICRLGPGTMWGGMNHASATHGGLPYSDDELDQAVSSY